MRSYHVIILLACFVIPGCNQTGTYNPTGKKQNSNSNNAKLLTNRLKAANTAKTVYSVYTGNLQLFCNSEITPYCVLLPLNELKEDFNSAPVEKAQHKFILKQDTAAFNSIEVQAFTIDKKNNYNTKLFYQRDKKNIEEGGLGIDSTYMDEAKHFYFIKGCLPNYTNMRFVQVNWILQNRIAIYFNFFDKEEALWMDWVNAIIQRGVTFSGH